jgi:hypothetical protein
MKFHNTAATGECLYISQTIDPTSVRLSNCFLKSSNYALHSIGSVDIDATNCIFESTASQAVKVDSRGQYGFTMFHACTFRTYDQAKYILDFIGKYRKLSITSCLIEGTQSSNTYSLHIHDPSMVSEGIISNNRFTGHADYYPIYSTEAKAWDTWNLTGNSGPYSDSYLDPRKKVYRCNDTSFVLVSNTPLRWADDLSAQIPASSAFENIGGGVWQETTAATTGLYRMVQSAQFRTQSSDHTGFRWARIALTVNGFHKIGRYQQCNNTVSVVGYDYCSIHLERTMYLNKGDVFRGTITCQDSSADYSDRYTELTLINTHEVII